MPDLFTAKGFRVQNLFATKGFRVPDYKIMTSVNSIKFLHLHFFSLHFVHTFFFQKNYSPSKPLKQDKITTSIRLFCISIHKIHIPSQPSKKPWSLGARHLKLPKHLKVAYFQ